jgi:chromosome partitioning protein
MSAVVAIASNKGGVAKTTTSLSLGGSLAEQGRFVLLVDLDPQAHLTASLGVKPQTLHRSVSDALLAQDSLVGISRETKVAGLDLAPASRELLLLEKVLYKRPRYEFRLRESLERMEQTLYDVVVVDCPPNFGTLTLNGLTAANLLIIPVQCEYYAIRSLRQTLELVTVVRRKTNPRLRYRLLVTMYDMRNKIHEVLLAELRDRFPRAMFETIIQVDTKLRESPAYGLPVTHHTPDTRAAHQYRALGQELITLLKPSSRAAPKAATMESKHSPEPIPSLPTRGS